MDAEDGSNKPLNGWNIGLYISKEAGWLAVSDASILSSTSFKSQFIKTKRTKFDGQLHYHGISRRSSKNGLQVTL